MFGLNQTTRWILFFTGVFLVVLYGLDHHHLLDPYPLLKALVFPYLFIVGLILIVVGHGFTETQYGPTGSGGVEGAPGCGSKKEAPFADFFGGDGGGSGGGE